MILKAGTGLCWEKQGLEIFMENKGIAALWQASAALSFLRRIPGTEFLA